MDSEISDYIAKSRARGASDEFIQSELLRVGWTKESIEPFLLLVSKETPKPRAVLVLVVIVVMMLSAVFTLIALNLKGDVPNKSLSVQTKETSTPLSEEKAALPVETGEQENVSVTNQTTPVSNSTETIQNAQYVREAEAKVTELLAKDNTGLVIVAPFNDILESGRKFTLVFTPVKDAAKYEVIITKPGNVPGRVGLIYSSRPDILLKQIIPSSTYTITVPEGKTIYTSEHSYAGEELIVKALDGNGRVMKISRISPYNGKRYETQAVATRQIKILSAPTDVNFLRSDKYVLGPDGGEITLTFAKLTAPFVSRKVFVGCHDLDITIDSVSCPKGDYSFTAGVAAFSKELVVKGNRLKGLRDTAFDVHEQLLDAKTGTNKGGLDDSFFVSIKLEK